MTLFSKPAHNWQLVYSLSHDMLALNMFRFMPKTVGLLQNMAVNGRPGNNAMVSRQLCYSRYLAVVSC